MLSYDVKTIFLSYFVFSIINSMISAVVWLQNRHLRGVQEIAAAYILSGIGLSIQSVDMAAASPLALFCSNLLLNLSQGMCANGIGIFLGRPNRVWLPVFCVMFTILIWPPALYFAPEERGLRVAAASVVTVVTFSHLLVAIGLGHSAWRWARLVVGALTVSHIAVALVRGYSGLRGLPPSISANGPLDVWTAFEIVIFANTLFLCFLAMVGTRLNSDLRARNQVLSDEVARRLRLERQLSSALATEVRMRGEQQQLIHIIGHEIRSPLAGIDRAAEMLMLGDAAILHRVDGIRERVRSTVGMIDRLLASERDSHALLRPEPLAVDEVIEIVVRGFEDVGAAHRIHVTASARSVPLVADQGMVMAILRNLIENALKYSPPEELVRVTVSYGADEVVIRVDDRGIGIPRAERDLIGHRFFRASNVGGVAGTGLGIFAVNRLLAAQGGRLAIEDGADGKGTAMIATFPLTCRNNVPELVDA
ncbi:HAMP domain-containing sensor histidine kinase [Azospirillum sp.]|uniref:sensor histidine kinase n=1 Tax=Azospirillum sp. TaxID=34012 RepID=UPI002637260D|nr:HAMP domain-containing sensor histidine kinase [Azospirillum sp.]